MRRVHPTAVVDPAAKLADDVCVGPYSVVGAAGVELEKGVGIGSQVVLTGSTRVGRRVGDGDFLLHDVHLAHDWRPSSAVQCEL